MLFCYPNNDHAIIYQYWDWGNDPYFFMDLNVPLILSIASVRSFNKKISIYVLDYSTHEKDWFIKNDLNFKVIKVNSEILTYCDCYGVWPPQRRPIDILKFSSLLNEKVIIFSDADVIWLKNPVPLNYDNKFHIVYNNAGFFYYLKGNDFIEYWADQCKKVILFDNYGKYRLEGMAKDVNDKFGRIDEEVLFRYLRDNKMFDESKIHYVNDEEQTLIGNFYDGSKCVKSMHFHTASRWKYHISKGNTILMIKEFYDIISKSIDLNMFENTDSLNSMNLEEFRKWMRV